MLLIDAPVGPYHPAEKIRDWLKQLEAMREEYAGDADAVAEIDHRLGEARGWLRSAPS